MQRQAITVHGVVQGVGFRPFVSRLATRLQLQGFVKNRTGSVLIEVQGERASISQFLSELQVYPPPLSQIDDISCQSVPPLTEDGFRIERSDFDSSLPVFISPDAATCRACLAELFDPADRRFQYPFINCTHCGPRLTIIRSAPYDRERTTMAAFTMCSSCQAEYDDPGNRRFHAQPNACFECGPRLQVLGGQGEPIVTDDPLACFASALRSGRIGALKGLGGYHLVCVAKDDQAVGTLRRRKYRDEKPLAVMVENLEAARRLCRIGAQEQALLESPKRPIVLLRKHVEAPLANHRVSDGVAPGNPYLGLMLPYTPLHHLLMRAVGRRPLVMTSGNRSDEPIATLDDEAIERLSPIADVFLIHNRPIHVRCDDSVTRIVDRAESPVRRSRGYAPQPVVMPVNSPVTTLAVGGQWKGVFALGRQRQAILSHHLGDLDQLAAFSAFECDIALYEQLFDVRPQLIVHDLHPDYGSTGYARRRAAESGMDRLPVQHHHAHMASCMAEHGLDQTVIGVSFDGTGLGTDQAIWGGEFLVGDYVGFRRAGHLRYVRLPGGDQAIREPWRIALAHLLDAGCDSTRLAGVSDQQRRTVEQMIAREFCSPLTSSAGRLFDAVAAIAGIRGRVSYEGQAAMQLEWLASDVAEDGVYPFDLQVPSDTDACIRVDTRPLVCGVVRDVDRGVGSEKIARRFHSTVVQIITAVCRHIRQATNINDVVLSGGVFMNALLTREVCERLRDEQFRVYRHQLVPPNDGGLSLGQLAIAAKVISESCTTSNHEPARVASVPQ